MSIRIDGESLTIEKVTDIARKNEKIEIPEKVYDRIKACRAIVEDGISKNKIMYGLNTGIGELAEVILPNEKIRDFQKFLVYSHAAGYGEPMRIEDVRAAMVSRINVLSKGHSGPRPVIVETLVNMLNRGVAPVVCQKGSVGACGDLSPLSQIALVLIGEGEAYFECQRLPAKVAMERAGIPTIIFEARDGLATINGSNFIAGMGSIQLYDVIHFIKESEIAAAMTLDALKSNMMAYDERIHKIRGYPGAVACAENVRRICEGSEILAQKDKKVQDSYSLRSTPQVVGSARDTLIFSKKMFEIELNGVGDNPIFFPDDGGTILTGANFQGTPLAFALEFAGIAVTTIAALSERRLNRIVNPHLSRGLPAFLTKGAGMFSGTMLTQYTAGALVCENRVLVHPAATGSIPAAADQEDFVSMGMTTAIKTRQIIDNAFAVVAIEFLNAAQGLEFRKPLKPGQGVKAAYDVIRKYIKPLDEDRPLYFDINKLTEVVKSGEILEAVEQSIGKLN